MTPDAALEVVERAYRKVRFTSRGFKGRGTRLEAVRAQLEALGRESDRVFHIIDFKSANRQRFEGAQDDDAQPATVPITLERLLRVPSMDRMMGRFLYELVRRLEPRVCIEIGTCIGVSGMYIAAGLRDNGVGRLVSFEGDPTLAELAQQNLDAIAPSQCEVVVGPFDETVPQGVRRFPRIDFAFSDQEHYLEPTMRDIDALAPRMPVGALLLIDDVQLNEEMRQTWRAVTEDPRCALGAQLYRLGRPLRMGVWIRGEDDGGPGHRLEVYGAPFDRPGRLIEGLRGLKRRFRND